MAAWQVGAGTERCRETAEAQPRVSSRPMDFLLARDDLHRCRFAEAEPPEPGPGQALLTRRAASG